MKISNRIFWASSIGISLLLASSACILEERNIEENEVFVCKTNDDCLKGSECVKRSSAQDAQGRCVKAEDVERCHDYDGDNYFKADEGFAGACGGVANKELDCDDDDPNVYPKDFEDACDGLDNNCDGCVDGNCPAGVDCYEQSNKTKCVPLERPCLGVQFKGVCAKDVAGYKLCKDAKFVEGHDNGGVFTERACLTADVVRYVNQEANAAQTDKSYCDGKDNDCNGEVDDSYLDSSGKSFGCEKCEMNANNQFCYYAVGSAKVSTAPDESNSAYANTCGGKSAEQCACKGKGSCSDGKYVCTNAKNAILKDGTPPSGNDETNWDANCDGTTL